MQQYGRFEGCMYKSLQHACWVLEDKAGKEVWDNMVQGIN